MARYLVTYLLGATVPTRIKYVDDATGPPDANDDAATLGVTVGSLWIDTTGPDVYVCTDATTAAAVWVELSGAGVIDHGALTGLGDDDHTQYVKDSEYAAKGDILGGTGSGTFDNLAVGTNGYILTADSAEATGLKWAAAEAGGVGEIIMSEDILDPPEPVWSEDGSEYLYAEP